MKKSIVILFFAVFSLSLVCADQWEYLTLPVDKANTQLPDKAQRYASGGLKPITPSNLQESLDILGRYRWELVSVSSGMVVMKRPYDAEASETENKARNHELGEISKARIITESESPVLFTLSIYFIESTVFSYEVERKKHEERNYRQKEFIQTPVNNGVVISALNGASMIIKITIDGKGYDIPIANTGPLKKEIKWVRNDDQTKFNLVVFSME